MSLHLLMIDNYDSFTFNLVQYLGELGATVEVVRHDKLDVDTALTQLRDGLVISPGPGSPQDAGISVPLIQQASGQVPILGVCLGHQSLATAFGGTIRRAATIMHGKTSPVRHHGSGIFAGLPNPFVATRYHSLVVERSELPECLVESAWTQDPDEEILMGMQHREHPSYGVQFHPESILTTAGKHMLKNFLTIVREHRS